MNSNQVLNWTNLYRIKHIWVWLDSFSTILSTSSTPHSFLTFFSPSSTPPFILHQIWRHALISSSRTQIETRTYFCKCIHKYDDPFEAAIPGSRYNKVEAGSIVDNFYLKMDLRDSAEKWNTFALALGLTRLRRPWISP